MGKEMKQSELNLRNARPEAEVFADLRELCSSPGYVHAIAFFCWRDNLIRYTGVEVVAEDLEDQHSHSKLIRTEIAALIGLTVQNPIDITLPAPSLMQDYIERTEFLLHELHQSLVKPWLQGWDVKPGVIPENDPFGTGEALREPIFYGGESAYNFQYHRFAPIKYRADENWIEKKKGFRIEQACQISEAIGQIQDKRQGALTQSLRKLPVEQWTTLPAFVFTPTDVVTASGLSSETVKRFLEAFSCGPERCNGSFASLSDFNVTNSRPIIKLHDGSYMLFQTYSLLESIYETPFFWMVDDSTYSPVALTNRGRYTEALAAERLEAIFGSARVVPNVDIYRGKDRFAEADVLVLYGDRAIVVQAKSKRLTLESRKGNDVQLKSDFKKAIQDAYEQAVLCAEALINDGFRFVAKSGGEIAIKAKPRVIFPVCIVSDHYPALAFQARQFLKLADREELQPPLVADVFALDAFAEMLDTPLHFLNYLALRSRTADKIIVSQELATLGFHLTHNLWVDGKYDMVNLGDEFASPLDIAMLARRTGLPGARTPKGILTRFENLTIGRIVAEIERAASPELTGLGLLLLQLSSEAAKALSSGIDRIALEAQRDGKCHDMSMAVDSGNSGITIHCSNFPEQIARERLLLHCRVRKHDTRASTWYGLLLDPVSGRIRGALACEDAWQPDPQMDEVMAVWPKVPPVQLSRLAGTKKVGRNGLCPCGSGRKYKKCCLKR